MAWTPDVDGVGVVGVVVVAVVVATVVVGAVGLRLAALEPLQAITVAARAARLAAPKSGCVINVLLQHLTGRPLRNGPARRRLL